ncbi:alpha/beta hydrolase family protein [Pedobacter deserti]|uniref:alpha/beta hydrolase family protein n=1 Tax=Pedobacter deserti TaxID=2817382 RepID=UPI00210928C1|nr:alpha/beta hydrolase [Pedobacter sp. SYSU D00382]
MKRLIIFCLLGVLAYGTSAQESDPSIWETKLGAIRIILKISTDKTTELNTALFDSPDQNAFDIPVSRLVIGTDSLIAFSEAMKQGFSGVFNSDRSKIQGFWNHSSGKVPVTFIKVVNFEVKRPQTPKPPFPYIIQDVTFYNKEKSIRFGATLTLPDLKSDYPAVIMITGSGAQDRDETAFGHKPFWVIADYLSRRGIAVLRVDDRGVGKSTGVLAGATSADFADDVLAAVEYLKKQVGINTKQIGLIGHSEGGVIGPIAATRSKDIAFLISLAGVGIKGSELMLAQGRWAYRNMGFTDEELSRIDTLNRLIYGLSERTGDIQTLAPLLKKEMAGWMQRQPESFLWKSGLKGPNSDKAMASMTSVVLNPWMRYFIAYDPGIYLSKLTIPVLAINGEKDVQVSAIENLEGFGKHLKEAGNKNFTTIAFPGLNHFFQHAETGDLNEYAKIEETIAPEVLETISKWINSQYKK